MLSILILSAIIPVGVIVRYIYIKDKFEKEPLHLLVFNFILGAVVSVVITIIISQIFNYLLPVTDKLSILQQLIKAFVVVAFVEEFSKYIIVRYYSQPKSAFNDPFDGIVYAVMVSMGFALTENVMYVLDGGLKVALLRAFTAVPAHAVFGVLMGYFMGKAKFSAHKRRLNLIGLLLAILFHGAYDFFLFIDFIPGIWTGAFVSLFLGLFLAHKAILKHNKRSYFKS